MTLLFCLAASAMTSSNGDVVADELQQFRINMRPAPRAPGSEAAPLAETVSATVGRGRPTAVIAGTGIFPDASYLVSCYDV